mgnify:CR=1 FL=1
MQKNNHIYVYRGVAWGWTFSSPTPYVKGAKFMFAPVLEAILFHAAKDTKLGHIYLFLEEDIELWNPVTFFSGSTKAGQKRLVKAGVTVVSPTNAATPNLDFALKQLQISKSEI